MPAASSRLIGAQASIALLCAILAVGLGLRLYGIEWGLPDAAHPGYSYHPDEMFHLVWAQALSRGQILAKQFMYGGTLYFTTLNSYIFFAGRLGQWLSGVNPLADAILFGRYFTTFIALVTIATVCSAGRVLFDTRTGLLAAAILAVAPGHIMSAQRVRPDEFGPLFVTLVLLLCGHILRDGPRASIKLYCYAGATVGLGAAMRLPFLMFLVAPFVAHLLVTAPPTWGRALAATFDRRMLAMGAVVVAAYVIGSPHSLIYPEGLLAGVGVQAWYQKGVFLDSVDAGPAIYQYGWTMLTQAFGFPLYCVGVAGVAFAFACRTRADWVILALAVPYFASLCLVSWVVVRYTLPLLPLLAILAARMVMHLATTWAGAPRRVLQASIAAALALTVVADVAFGRLCAGVNSREFAAQWLQVHAPRGAKVATVRLYPTDEYFNPALAPDFREIVFLPRSRANPHGLLDDPDVGWFVVNETVYLNAERLGAHHPIPEIPAFHDALAASAFEQVAAFKPAPVLIGLDFSAWFSASDYAVVNPGIRIYKRRA